jgi:hypothetical protein
MERPTIPPDVQLRIAESLLNEDVVPASKLQATLARLLPVSQTFLHFGLQQLYERSSFDAYEDSLARIQLIRYDTPHRAWAQLDSTFFIIH